MRDLSQLEFLPRPRHIHPTPGNHVAAGLLSWEGAAPGAVRALDTLTVVGQRGPTVALSLSPDVVGAEAYRLRIGGEGVRIEASTEEGLFRGGTTLLQVIDQAGADLPCGVIEDSPDFAERGVMLDISRDKVPTMATLFRLVDEFARWKFNRLQLYTEHTFAYRNHREVWEHASPMTHEDVQALDSYCRERFIELVPNLNTFGHMHRWLKVPRYRDLAECPDGYVTPWSERRSDPFSLNPVDPRSIALVGELIDELLPLFASRTVNVGCDETFDLGQGKSREACEARGKGRVYVEYLLKVYDKVRSHGHTMQFWGDIILRHPELIPELPRDLVALVWGYEATHPFDEQCAAFAKSGIPFQVCPGTSTWCTIGGRTDNMLANIRSAAQAGLAHGATGMLVTDWGDNGHWQPLPVSYPGFAWGAAMSWCVVANERLPLPRVLDAHVFHDRAGVMGRLVMELGNTYQQTGHLIHNASALFRILQLDKPDKLLASVADTSLVAANRFVIETMNKLEDATMARDDEALIRDELTVAAQMLIHACARGKAYRAGTDRNNPALAQDMSSILADYMRNWLARNREGGMVDSTRVLERRLAEYLTPT